MKLDDTFHGISTLVKSMVGNIQVQGSAFFYLEYGERNKEKPQWIAIANNWLVTNRHIILPKIDGKETIPDKFIFNLWRIESNAVKWLPVELTKQDLLKRVKVHSDPEVDVAIIQILDILNDIIKNEPRDSQTLRTSILAPVSMSKEKLAGNNKIYPEVADDIIVIGYPREFYDLHNVFPIIKSGIIASKWGANFNGKRCFLIDAKLFPGSSGSIVISKPKDLVVENGQVLTAKEKQFGFLGIFSGEPFKELQTVETDDMMIKVKAGFNVGIVWYGELIEEIIHNGKSL